MFQSKNINEQKIANEEISVWKWYWMREACYVTYKVQCPPLNRITLGQHKSDNNNRMIQLTDVFCVLFRYIMGSPLSDYNKRLIQLSVIQLSGGHCIINFVIHLNLVK